MRYKTPILFALVILVSGCVGQGNGEEVLSHGQFLGGELGLELNYIEVPPRVFQSDEFAILLEVNNKGETDVEVGDALFRLSNSNVFSITENEKKNEEPLLKATAEKTFGGQTFIEYSPAKYIGGVLSSESPITISIDACYPYETVAAVDLCVARSEFSEVCSPVEEKDVDNSGAPVQVTKAEQTLSLLTNNKVRVGFKLTVEAKGEETDAYYKVPIETTGESVEGRAGTTCEVRQLEFANEVTVKELRIGSAVPYTATEIESACGSSSIRFDDEGVAELNCNFQIDNYVIGAGDYVERMTVTFGYLHNTLANTEIFVIPN